MTEAQTPAQDYAARLAAREAERARLAVRESRLSWLRLGAGLSGFAVAWFVFGPADRPAS